MTPEVAQALESDGMPADNVLKEAAQTLLFTTPTCPNCRAAGALLSKAGVAYQTLNANEEAELVERYGVKQAPTLVIAGDDGFEKYRGVSDIKGWIKQL